MQPENIIKRENLGLVIAFFVGVAVGLMLTRGKFNIGTDNRISAHFVFGNVMIGSNNGESNTADFGVEDSGDNG